MDDLLFMFLANAVAAEAPKYRPGARHALMLFGKGQTLDRARNEAISGALSHGWTLIEVKREKQINNEPEEIDDEILRAAASSCLLDGSALVVYADEIPSDS